MHFFKLSVSLLFVRCEFRKALKAVYLPCADKEQRYRQFEEVHLSKGQKLNRLKELSKMYALYAPIQATYKESQSLKGLAKMKYDKEHKESLEKYPEIRERMQR